MKTCYEKKSFTEHFRRINPNLLVSDESSRIAKAQKIYAILKDYIDDLERLKKSWCLDLGCSEGRISHFMSERVGHVIGLDTDRPALQVASNTDMARPVYFVCGSGLELPFQEQSFDIVICNQIYEHVPDPVKLMDEIRRILKDQGVCFFGAGNRYKVIEGHYLLPFLSWLPKSLADLYLRITGKGESYEEQHFSYFGIKRLVRKFQVRDYTIDVIKAPDRFSYVDAPRTIRFLSIFPRWLLTLFLPLSPNYLYILTSKKHDRSENGGS